MSDLPKDSEATFSCGVCDADVTIDIVNPSYLFEVEKELLASQAKVALLERREHHDEEKCRNLQEACYMCYSAFTDWKLNKEKI